MDNKDFPPDKLAADVDEAQQRMLILEGSTYVPPVFAWKHPVAVTSIGFVTDETLGASSSNTAWLGTVLTDSLYRYPLAADGSGFDFSGDTGLNDRVDDNTEKGDVGESAKYVVGTGFGVVTGIVHAPDGLLYVSSISAGAVYRIGPADTVGGASPAPSASAATSDAPSGATVEVTVGTDTGAELKFDPAEVTVRAGADVRLTFENRSVSPAQPDLPRADQRRHVDDRGAGNVGDPGVQGPGSRRIRVRLHLASGHGWDTRGRGWVADIVGDTQRDGRVADTDSTVARPAIP